MNFVCHIMSLVKKKNQQKVKLYFKVAGDGCSTEELFVYIILSRLQIKLVFYIILLATVLFFFASNLGDSVNCCRWVFKYYHCELYLVE